MTEAAFLNVLRRKNVKVTGSGERAMVFAHGFGCDQNMWRFVWPAFAEQYRIVLFDHVGCGNSDLNAYDAAKYGSLEGYRTTSSTCVVRSTSPIVFSSGIPSAR